MQTCNGHYDKAVNISRKTAHGTTLAVRKDFLWLTKWNKVNKENKIVNLYLSLFHVFGDINGDTWSVGDLKYHYSQACTIHAHFQPAQ